MQDFLVSIMPFALLLAVAYFLLIRPQSKRMKAQQEAVAALQPGDRVLTHSGIFATVSHVGEAQMILELAPGAEITVLKAAISRKVRDDEEEFEFSDDTTDPADEEAAELDGAPADEDVVEAAAAEAEGDGSDERDVK